MKVLSLFDGMSCGQIALRQLMLLNGFENLRVDTYYASEIDKYAIAQTRHNFPDTVQLGDVERWREWDIDWEHLDLVMGGSPCQGFSFAGKQLAFDDPRSRLFFVFAEILDYARAHNPKVKFLLENVNMKKKHLRIISERVGVFPVNINSALVSAQNRNRWYWTDIRARQEGFFGEVYSDIPQPEDRGILLRDILEPEVDEKYYLPDKSVRKLLEHKKRNDEAGNGFGKTFHNPDGKMSALKIGGSGADDLVCVRMIGRNPENPSDRRAGIYLEQTLEAKTDGKTNCLTSVAKDNLILQRPQGKNNGGFHAEKAPTLSANAGEQNNLVIQRRMILEPEQMKEIIKQNPRYMANYRASSEKAHTLLSSSYKGAQANGMTLVNDGLIRRLTPTECARLQTIPEWYEWNCSETQQYRMLGNGWTVEVIKHILSYGQWE